MKGNINWQTYITQNGKTERKKNLFSSRLNFQQYFFVSELIVAYDKQGDYE